MSTSHADENLLFGVLALQLDFIGRTELIAAVSDWTLMKSQRLADILVERGAIAVDDRVVLDNLVHRHLARHNQDTHRSLAALKAFEEVRHDLQHLNDPDVTSSVGYGSGPSAGIHAQQTANYIPDSSSRFKVLRLHAKGGLGKVSVAVDRELNREVAVKEIHAKYADHSESRARFRLEAEITGGLEHPGVVPVYSLGAHADGRPYYAMRFIRGESLRDAIKKYHATLAAQSNSRERRLTLRHLLGQLVDVCHVMQYSHDRGVLHRDLKPDNVMVGDYGETLVVDWGLAKSLDDQTAPAAPHGLSRLKPSSGSQGTHTVVGSAMGTPAYMSPEQAAGKHDTLTAASDVYSLGATLYCVLADRPPIAADSVETALIKAQKGDFPPPREISPWTPPALNSICLKAMATSLAERYVSARELAEDLERWLADEPVTAYRESFVERAARWLRRHRSWTISGVAALLSVAFVSTVALFAVNHARQEEARQKGLAQQLAEDKTKLAASETAAKREAEQRFREARSAIDTWLTGTAPIMRNAPGMQKARENLLQQAASDYERFAREAGPDRDLILEQARASRRLGDVRRLLTQFETAERDYLQAEQLLGALIEQAPGQVGTQLELVNCQTSRGLLLAGLDQPVQGEALLQHALAACQHLVTAAPQNPACWQALGTTWFNLGYAHDLLGNPTAAESDFARSIDAFQRLRNLRAEDFRNQADLSQSLAWHGRMLYEERDLRGAASDLQQSLQWFATLIERDPENPDYRLTRAESLLLLSGVQRSTGDAKGELETLNQAVEDYALILAPTEVLRHQVNFAITRTDRGQFYHELGQTRAALAEFDDVLDEIAQFRRISQDDVFFLEVEATCHDMRGETLRELGRPQEAEASHRYAVTALEQLAKEAPETTGYGERLEIGRSHLGQALAAQKKIADAEPLLRGALIELNKMQADSPDTPQFKDDAAWVSSHLAEILWDAGQQPSAEAAWTEAVQTRRELAEKWPIAEYRIQLAWLLVNCPAAALADPAAALAAAQETLKEAPENADAWSAAGAAQFRAGDLPSSIASLLKAVELRVYPVAIDHVYLGLAYAAQQNDREAAVQVEKGKSLFQEAVPGNVTLRRLLAEAELTQLD